MRIGYKGNLLLYDIYILLVGYHPEVGIGANALETVNSELYQRSSTSKDVNELLGILGRGKRPKARAYATSHNNYVIHKRGRYEQ